MGGAASRFVCIRGREWPRIIVSIPSSRDRATVRRTVAFRSSSLPTQIKTPKPKGFGVFMELLARFELATSSLPKVHFRKISSKYGIRYRFLQTLNT